MTDAANQLTSHVTNDPGVTARILNEDHAGTDQSALPLGLAEALQHAALRFLVEVDPVQGLADLRQIALDIVVLIVELDYRLLGLVLLAMGYQPERRPMRCQRTANISLFL